MAYLCEWDQEESGRRAGDVCVREGLKVSGRGNAFFEEGRCGRTTRVYRKGSFQSVLERTHRVARVFRAARAIVENGHAQQAVPQCTIYSCFKTAHNRNVFYFNRVLVLSTSSPFFNSSGCFEVCARSGVFVCGSPWYFAPSDVHFYPVSRTSGDETHFEVSLFVSASPSLMASWLG